MLHVEAEAGRKGLRGVFRARKPDRATVALLLALACVLKELPEVIEAAAPALVAVLSFVGV